MGTRHALLLAGIFGSITLGACQPNATTVPNIGMLSIARDAARFAISSSTDTTVVFRQAEARWLRGGMRGSVVDPLQRDAFIARITIQQVDTGGIVALIAGGVSPVKETHIVLFEKPAIVWWRDKRFWLGAAGGVVVGITGASAAK